LKFPKATTNTLGPWFPWKMATLWGRSSRSGAGEVGRNFQAEFHCRYVDSMLAVVETRRQHGYGFFAFLTAAVEAQLATNPHPHYSPRC
jgi:hypothetical protein